MTVILFILTLAGFIVGGFIFFAVVAAAIDFELTYSLSRQLDHKSRSEAGWIALVKALEFEDAKAFLGK